jgi:hypothetical protein
MFEGKGKRNGKLLADPAEYDRAYVTQLVNLGVADAAELTEALLARPDGHAQSKGADYALALVEEILTAREAAAAEVRASQQELFEEARRHTDFTVDEVHIVESDASRYELHIEGKVLVLCAKELSTHAEFKQAFVNLLHRVPVLPPTRGKKAALWDALVNSWLVDAFKQKLIGNATDEEVLRRAVEKAKTAIVVGETAEALHDDMAFESNGHRYFTADAVYDRVKHLDSKLKQRHVVRLFPELGCEFHPGFPAGSRPIDVWSEPLPPREGSGGAGACTGGAADTAGVLAKSAGQPEGGAQVGVASEAAVTQ